MSADDVSIADAADELGVSTETIVAQMVADGMLLAVPGEEDPDCAAFTGGLWHLEGCGCRFVPAPHPSVRRCGSPPEPAGSAGGVAEPI